MLVCVSALLDLVGLEKASIPSPTYPKVGGYPPSGEVNEQEPEKDTSTVDESPVDDRSSEDAVILQNR